MGRLVAADVDFVAHLLPGFALEIEQLRALRELVRDPTKIDTQSIRERERRIALRAAREISFFWPETLRTSSSTISIALSERRVEFTPKFLGTCLLATAALPQGTFEQHQMQTRLRGGENFAFQILVIRISCHGKLSVKFELNLFDRTATSADSERRDGRERRQVPTAWLGSRPGSIRVERTESVTVLRCRSRNASSCSMRSALLSMVVCSDSVRSVSKPSVSFRSDRRLRVDRSRHRTVKRRRHFRRRQRMSVDPRGPSAKAS